MENFPVKQMEVCSFCYNSSWLYRPSHSQHYTHTLRPWTGVTSIHPCRYISSRCQNNWLYIDSFFAIPLAIQMITSAIILARVAKLQNSQRAWTLKIARTLTLTLLMYYICWVPYMVLIIWEAIPGANPSPWLYTIATNFAIANSSIWALLYITWLYQSLKKLFTSWSSEMEAFRRMIVNARRIKASAMMY